MLADGAGGGAFLVGGGAGAEARTPEGKVPLLTPILGGGSPGARPWKPGWDSRWRGGVWLGLGSLQHLPPHCQGQEVLKSWWLGIGRWPGDTASHGMARDEGRYPEPNRTQAAGSSLAFSSVSGLSGRSGDNTVSGRLRQANKTRGISGNRETGSQWVHRDMWVPRD